MKEISNNVLAVLVIVAVAITAASTMVLFSSLGGPVTITGLASQPEATGTATVTLASEVAIKLNINTVAFNSLGASESNDTVDLNPWPFVIQNTGSACANISIGATELFDTHCAGAQCSEYRYNVSNNETVTKNSWRSDIYWVPYAAGFGDIDPSVNATVIENMSWEDNKDDIRVHIFITDPTGLPSEPRGAKSSTVYFEAVAETGC